MKQKIYTNWEKFVKDIPLLKKEEKPIKEIFVFENDFSLRQISESDVFPNNKAVFMLYGSVWNYYDPKKNRFEEITDSVVIDRLVKPTYEKFLRTKPQTGTL